MAVIVTTGASAPGATGATGTTGAAGSPANLLDAATLSVSVKNAPYSAKGDGKVVGSAVMTAGSNQLSVSGGFVSGDAGKVVIVNGAGAGGGVSLGTTSADLPVGNGGIL